MATIALNGCTKFGGTITHLQTWRSRWLPPHSVNTGVKQRPDSPFKFIGPCIVDCSRSLRESLPVWQVSVSDCDSYPSTHSPLYRNPCIWTELAQSLVGALHHPKAPNLLATPTPFRHLFHWWPPCWILWPVQPTHATTRRAFIYPWTSSLLNRKAEFLEKVYLNILCFWNAHFVLAS